MDELLLEAQGPQCHEVLPLPLLFSQRMEVPAEGETQGEPRKKPPNPHPTEKRKEKPRENPRKATKNPSNIKQQERESQIKTQGHPTNNQFRWFMFSGKRGKTKGTLSLPKRWVGRVKRGHLSKTPAGCLKSNEGYVVRLVDSKETSQTTCCLLIAKGQLA